MKNKTNWKHIRETVVNDVNEMNEILKEVATMCPNIYFRKKEPDELIKWNAFIEDNGYTLKVTYKPYKKAITYKFDMDGKRFTKATPVNATSQMSRAFKIEKTQDILGIDSIDIPDCTPLLYKNKDYDGKAEVAYEYDLSQAYAQMLKLPLPVTSSMKVNAKLSTGQIGFVNVGDSLKLITDPEEFDDVCDYVFDTMESPYIKWVDTLFKRCEEAKTKEEKDDIKNIYRYAIGCLRNTNEFWRATIVGRCNNLILKYVSKDPKNVLYCNTDSIISKVRRPDIENDKDFTWKLKHEGCIFKWQKGKMNYQWDLEIPSMKGPLQRYIKYYNETHDEKWDILKDPIPKSLEHEYSLDRATLQIKEN